MTEHVEEKARRIAKDAIRRGVVDPEIIARFATRELFPDSAPVWKLQSETAEQKKLMSQLMPTVLQELSRHRLGKADQKVLAILEGAIERFPTDPTTCAVAVFAILPSKSEPSVRMKKATEMVIDFHLANGKLPQLFAAFAI